MPASATTLKTTPLEECLAALNGELPAVTREHVRVTVKEFLAAGDTDGERVRTAPIRLSLFADRLRVEGIMHRASNSLLPESIAIKRRGLDLVQQLADRWGIVEGEPPGYWFELDRRE